MKLVSISVLVLVSSTIFYLYSTKLPPAHDVLKISEVNTEKTDASSVTKIINNNSVNLVKNAEMKDDSEKKHVDIPIEVVNNNVEKIDNHTLESNIKRDSSSSKESQKEKNKTEENNKLLKKINDFHIDTSWPPRTLEINGAYVYYNFGDGNPPSVDLSPEDIEKLPSLVRTLPSNHTTYMKADAELALKDFLDDQNLPIFLNKCSKLMSVNMKNVDFSMESILYIDIKTGRKEFKEDFISGMGNGLSVLRSPVNPEKWKECLDESDSYIMDDLQRKFSQIIDNYIIYENPIDDEKQVVRQVAPEILNSTPPPGYNTNTDSDYINNGKI